MSAGKRLVRANRWVKETMAVCLLLASLPVRGAEPDISESTHASQAFFDSAVLRWNWEARDIVRRNRVDPLWAVRTYALVSLAQYEAAKAAEAANGGGEFMAAAIATGAARVLAHVYPHEVPTITARLRMHSETFRDYLTAAELEGAQTAGQSAARAVIEERATDGAVSLETIEAPAQARVWHSDERWAPLRADWGRVRPFLIQRPSDFDAPPPPALDSAPFLQALQAVKDARGSASAENERIARKWADGPGTTTPPGHWNLIATELIRRHELTELDSALVLASLNMALMDASILCWRAKFTFWLQRPSQADPQIDTSFPLPNFPSYPSGHAAFSGAASAFLAHRFPAERDALARWAEEAALSRVVAGVHYPFDSEAGLLQGRRIAELAIARYRSEARRSRAMSTR